MSIFVLTVLGIQLVFLTAYLVTFVKHKPRVADAPVPVSVIVAAHDEEQNLRTLIPLLLQQEYNEFEIIVVEDRCNDGTYDYLLQATKDFAKLKMVRVVHKPEHIQGKKFALTLGIKAARYDWVLLTDADCRPVSDLWINDMMGQRNEQTEIILGFSPYIKMPGLLNAFIRFESLITSVQFLGLAKLGKPYMGVGRNLAYKKALFIENKGFHPFLELTGGDDDLFVNRHARKGNVAVCLSKNAMMNSIPKRTWSDFFSQKIRHLSVGKHYKFSDRAISALFLLSWMACWLIALPILIAHSFYWGAGLFVLRLVLLAGLLHAASKAMGTRFEAWKVPFLDFIYAFYYLVTGLRALVVKKVKWKN